jgi:hypothetical protein
MFYVATLWCGVSWWQQDCNLRDQLDLAWHGSTASRCQLVSSGMYFFVFQSDGLAWFNVMPFSFEPFLQDKKCQELAELLLSGGLCNWAHVVWLAQCLCDWSCLTDLVWETDTEGHFFMTNYCSEVSRKGHRVQNSSSQVEAKWHHFKNGIKRKQDHFQR